MRIVINANVEWRIERLSDRSWMGVCDPLGLTLEADSQAELHESIFQAMDLLFRDLIEENEFDEYLRARGWTSTTELPALEDIDGFEVPVSFLAKQGPNHACA